MSHRTVRRILHRDLHIHPFKVMITHELSERDFQTRRTAYEDILQNILPGAVLISSDEAHLYLSGSVNINKNSATGQQRTLSCFISDHYTALGIQFCASLLDLLVRHLQSPQFQSSNEVKSASQAELKDMAENGFQKSFDELYKLCQSVLLFKGLISKEDMFQQLNL
ncbi:DUF4817 domain-containing protein [Trichonephila clavipes]|nr:DUF4817 domain-containing protein [Trichonephila clavipes]